MPLRAPGKLAATDTWQTWPRLLVGRKRMQAVGARLHNTTDVDLCVQPRVEQSLRRGSEAKRGVV